MPSTFNFPSGIDQFFPDTLSDAYVVSASHVLDLRESILAIENTLIANTTIDYSNTNIIEDGYNVKKALETLDYHLSSIEQQLGFEYVDGYATRISTLESDLLDHREASYQIDQSGHTVHDVDGYVVGTLNPQQLDNKTVDSGLEFIGPKFVARVRDGGDTNHQIQVIGSDTITEVAYITHDGSAYFKGDLIVDGYRIIKGTDLVQNSLTVEGNTVLGNNKLVDTVIINGNTDIDGTLTVSDNIIFNGTNGTFGDSLGSLNLNYQTLNLSGDGYITGNLSVDGGVSLGDGTGSDPIELRGPINHIGDHTWSSGSLRILGDKFKIEGNKVTISDTLDTEINSTTTKIASGATFTVFDSNGITADGYQFIFDNTAGSTTLSVGGTLNAEDLFINNNITISTGNITSPLVIATQLNTTQLKVASSSLVGQVLKAVDTIGNAQWDFLSTWNTMVISGPFYTATTRDEIFADTSSGTFTINLPSSPAVGDRVRVIDYNGNFSIINKALIYPASGLIMGLSHIELTVADSWVEIVYNGISWRVISK